MKINSLIQMKIIIALLSCFSLINAAEAPHETSDRKKIAAQALLDLGWLPTPNLDAAPTETVSTLPSTPPAAAQDNTVILTPSDLCKRCNACFSNPLNLSKHRSKARNAKAQGLLCNVPTCCSFFEDSASKDEHRRTLHEKKEIYGCSACERKFKIKGCARTHTNVTHRERRAHLTIECEKCSLFYDYDTRNHTCEAGAPLDLLPPVATPPTPACVFCAKTFDTWKKARDHESYVRRAKKDNLCCDAPGCCSVATTLELKEKHMLVHEFHLPLAQGDTQSKRARHDEEKEDE